MQADAAQRACPAADARPATGSKRKKNPAAAALRRG